MSNINFDQVFSTTVALGNTLVLNGPKPDYVTFTTVPIDVSVGVLNSLYTYDSGTSALTFNFTALSNEFATADQLLTTSGATVSFRTGDISSCASAGLGYLGEVVDVSSVVSSNVTVNPTHLSFTTLLDGTINTLPVDLTNQLLYDLSVAGKLTAGNTLDLATGDSVSFYVNVAVTPTVEYSIEGVTMRTVPFSYLDASGTPLLITAPSAVGPTSNVKYALQLTAAE